MNQPPPERANRCPHRYLLCSFQDLYDDGRYAPPNFCSFTELFLPPIVTEQSIEGLLLLEVPITAITSSPVPGATTSRSLTNRNFREPAYLYPWTVF